MTQFSNVPSMLWALVLTATFAFAQDGGSNAGSGQDGPGVPTSAVAVFTNLPTSPVNQVPGLTGVAFQSSTTSTAIFDRPFGNRFGSWAIRASTDQGTALNDIILFDGLVVAQEGTPIPGLGGELYGIFDQQLGVSEVGTVLFANNTDALTTSDEIIALVDLLGNPIIVAREGDPTPLAGINFGTTLNAPTLLADGTPAFIADLVTGATTATDEIWFLGGTPIAQAGVSLPIGQFGGTSLLLENLDLGRSFFDATGAHSVYQGDLTGTTQDDVLVVDGRVVLQEGFALPGFTSPISAAVVAGVNMGPAGDWIARGSNLDGEDWVLLNGQVIARRGALLGAGQTERWDDASFAALFFAHVVDSFGNFVIGGVTDGPVDSNGVIVWNNEVVLVREGEAIDVDGNGLLDDDTFFNTFGNDDFYLSDLGLLYFTATLRNGAGTGIGQGFFFVTTPSAASPAAAAGTIVDANGLRQTSLNINGFTGGGSRNVTLSAGTPFSLNVDNLTGASAAEFALFAFPGVPTPADQLPLSPFGTFYFTPAIAGLPTASFTVASGLPSFLVTPGLFPASLPYALSVPGLPSGFVATFQATFVQLPNLFISNAVTLTVL